MIDIYKEIKKLTSVNQELAKSIDFCHEKIDDCHTSVKQLNQGLKECFLKIESTVAKCDLLEKENIQLKTELNSMQQYSRLNNLEIRGVPEIKNENILSVVAGVGRALGVDICERDVDACHRMGKFNLDSAEPRSIILKFVSRLKKQQFLKARSVKRNLCVGDLDDDWKKEASGKRSVYINEHLTSENKALFKKCREFKKDKNIKYLWVTNGQIKMRKTDNSTIYIITNEKSLNDVH